MKKIFLIHIIAFSTITCFSQVFPEKEMLKKLKAREIEMDEGNGDGVFKAKSRATKKWGMYQWMFDGVKTRELIPMEYDSVKYIPFNGAFSAVYKEGKVGFYLSTWSYNDNAKQTVPCLYNDYQRFTIKNRTYLAVMKNKKWGWVDWFTGAEKSEFIYNTKEELITPDFEQNYR